jgi:hypothetical protein
MMVTNFKEPVKPELERAATTAENCTALLRSAGRVIGMDHQRQTAATSY